MTFEPESSPEVGLFSRANNDVPRPPLSEYSLEEPVKLGSSHRPKQLRSNSHTQDCSAGRQRKLSLFVADTGNSIEINVGKTTHRIAVADNGAA